jgi:tRNA nucleotidyltransferase (CCA-adding enzyme)
MTKIQTYLVGGAIRDQQLGLNVYDKDWVVVGSSAELLLKQGFQQVGLDFPVFLHPKTKEEHALARTERKSGKGYHGFVTDSSEAVTLEQDLQRRDLTINAIAQDSKGNFIDPYSGLDDLKNKILKHVSPSFNEDPVRILRVARFAAKLYHLGFKVDKSTLKLMKTMVQNGEVNALVAERVWQETEKALKTSNPQVFFEILKSVGALKVLFPEIHRLFGVPQPFKWHPEIDCGIHTMMVLQQCTLLTKDPIARFAALCHDLGKGTTPIAILPSHKLHELRGVDEIKILCKRLKVPSKYKKFATKMAEYHTHCHKITELKAKTILKVIKAFDAIKQPELLAKFTLTCKADARGRTGHESIPYQQKDIIDAIPAQLKIINFGKIAKNCKDKSHIPLRIDEAQIKVIKSIQASW